MEDDLMKMLNDASSESKEETDTDWVEEDPLTDYVAQRKADEEIPEEQGEDPSDDAFFEEDVALKQYEEGYFSDGEDSEEDEDEYDEYEDYDEEEEKLLIKMRKQSEQYDKEIRKMQKSREQYEASKRRMEEKQNRRGFFELDLNKSNLKGDTILDRLGYDPKAKNNPKYHKVENYIDSHIANPKLRFALYLGFAILCILLAVIPQFLT